MKRKLPIQIDLGLKKKLGVLVNLKNMNGDTQTQVPVRVKGAMENLHQLEEEVLEFIFFDSNNAPHSLKEAAEKFELTLKEVENIYSQGLRKLRGGRQKGFPPVSWN